MTLFTWLALAAWKGSLLLLVMVLLLAVLRDRIPPRWRFALLFVAMLRLVLPFAPAAPFSVFNLAPRADAPLPLRIAVAPSPTGAAPQIVVLPRPASPLQALQPWKPLAAAVWAFGALALIGRVTWRSIRMQRRIHRDRVAAPPPHVLELLQVCREDLGIQRNVELRLTNVVSSPSLHGVWRPALLLPADLPQSLTAEQLRFVFLHELAHFRRFDVFLNWVMTCIYAMHWFNPLVWFATIRLAEDRELACDAVALGALGRQERNAYGATVIELLDRLRMPSPVPALVGMAPTRQQAKRRIQMIASFRNESGRAAWFAVAVVAVALVSLTDATAGEKVFIRHAAPLSPEAKAAVETLSKEMSLELTSARLEDVVNAVSNATGVSFRYEDDALGQTAPITLKAKDIPAHVVLNESLAAFGLAVRFSADGNTILKQPEEHARVMHLPAGEEEKQVIVMKRKHKTGDEDSIDAEELPDLPELRAHRAAGDRIRIQVEAQEIERDGVVRRNVKYFSKDNKEGSLTLEVKK